LSSACPERQRAGLVDVTQYHDLFVLLHPGFLLALGSSLRARSAA
jgi:hypothetical protein